MIRPLILTAFFLSTGFLAVSSHRSAAAEEPGKLPPSLVLLKNGNLLEGQVARDGGFYRVSSSHGEIRIRAAEVATVCHDLDEAYRYRRSMIQPSLVHDHLELAGWCIRQHLYEFAAAELAAADKADPGHPRIPLLKRRLELARELPSSVSDDATIQTTSPTVDELERMVRGMPPGSVETFTNTIQPLLVNTCSTSACHGPETTTDFKLLRIPANRPPGRRATQRNLYAALKWINARDPEQSPLLTVSIQPHGAARITVFPDPTTQSYRRLVAWVQQVTRGVSARRSPGRVSPASNTLLERYRALQQPPVHDANAAMLERDLRARREGRSAKARKPKTGVVPSNRQPSPKRASRQPGRRGAVPNRPSTKHAEAPSRRDG